MNINNNNVRYQGMLGRKRYNASENEKKSRSYSNENKKEDGELLNDNKREKQREKKLDSGNEYGSNEDLSNFGKYSTQNNNSYYQKERNMNKNERPDKKSNLKGYIDNSYVKNEYYDSYGSKRDRNEKTENYERGYHNYEFDNSRKIKGKGDREKDWVYEKYDHYEKNEKYEKNDRIERNEDYYKYDKSEKYNEKDKYLHRQNSRSRRDDKQYSSKRYNEKSQYYTDEDNSYFEKGNYKKYDEGVSYKERHDDDRLRRPLENTIKKKFNFLIVLPKNYFRYIEQDYDYLYSEIKRKVRDIYLFQYDYKINGFGEYILRIDAPKVTAKALAMKITCETLFNTMKQTFHNMSYLKVSVLVPNHVVGFIIGIDGKNINLIRDLSGARIDVFQPDIADKYRQIELQGSPENISKACEKIYKIVNKYYFFNPVSKRREERRRSNSENKHKPTEGRRKVRVRLGIRERRVRNESVEERDIRMNRNRSTSHRRARDDNIRRRDYSKSRINRRGSEQSTREVIERKDSKEISNISKKKIDDINEANLSEFYPNISRESKISEKFEEDKNLVQLPSKEISKKEEIKNEHQDINFNLVPENISLNMTEDKSESKNEFENNMAFVNKLNNNEGLKIPLNIIVPNQSLDFLKNIKGNIFIEIENKYHCSISKKVEKLGNNDVNILTLSGTPEQNCMATYFLQQAMSGKTDIFKNS